MDGDAEVYKAGMFAWLSDKRARPEVKYMLDTQNPQSLVGPLDRESNPDFSPRPRMEVFYGSGKLSS